MGRWTHRLVGAGVLAGVLGVFPDGAPSGVLSADLAHAAPEPSPLPFRWEFDLRVGPLRMETITLEDGIPRSYFYLTYVVTNRTGEDRPFTPSWVMTTDTGLSFVSGRGVPMEVTRQLLEKQDNPYLEDQVSILGRLQQGRINARDGIVIWPAPDLRVDELRVYASGFSGESTRIQTIDPETGREQEFVLRKTRMVRYEVPGTLRGSEGREIKPVEYRWIMR